MEFPDDGTVRILRLIKVCNVSHTWVTLYENETLRALNGIDEMNMAKAMGRKFYPVGEFSL